MTEEALQLRSEQQGSITLFLSHMWKTEKQAQLNELYSLKPE